MTRWSARAALRNMPLGLVPLAIFGLGCAFAAKCPDDDCEGVAIITSLLLCGAVGTIIGWRRPNGFLGAALGAALALGTIMVLFRTTKFPLIESAMFGGLVGASELSGIVGRALVRRIRYWSSP